MKLFVCVILLFLISGVYCHSIYIPPQGFERYPSGLTYVAPKPTFSDHITGKQNDASFAQQPHFKDNNGNNYYAPNNNPTNLEQLNLLQRENNKI